MLKTEEERELRSLLWMLLLQNGSVVSMTKREPRKTNDTVDLQCPAMFFFFFPLKYIFKVKLIISSDPYFLVLESDLVSVIS